MSLFEQFRLLHPGWRDIVEVLIVSFAIYRVLLLIHRTRAMQVLVGLVVLAVAYGVAYLLHFGMIVYLLTLIFSYGAIALLVVFAPELRAALAQIGQSPMSRLLGRMHETEVGDQVAEAVERLSRSGIGAIIAIEREVSLTEYVQSGSEMQAKVSADLLATIFTPTRRSTTARSSCVATRLSGRDASSRCRRRHSSTARSARVIARPWA